MKNILELFYRRKSREEASVFHLLFKVSESPVEEHPEAEFFPINEL